MIGNDVIDLKVAAAESDWRRKGYLEKLFSDSEITMILSSDAPDISVWNLWSKKEATYKIFNRQTGIRLFNPKHFECADLLENSQVFFDGQAVFCKTEITSELIHTIACQSPDHFADLALVSRQEVSKQNGWPVFRQTAKLFPATVSHHGNFVKCLALVRDRFDVNLAVKDAVNGTFFSNLE